MRQLLSYPFHDSLHMKVEPIEWLILGVTPNGRIFRPSDWAERLCGALAHYDSHGRWVYSKFAQPIIHQGQIGVRVKTILKELDPNTYQFIMGFAHDNLLNILPGREIIYLNKTLTVIEIMPLERKLNSL